MYPRLRRKPLMPARGGHQLAVRRESVGKIEKKRGEERGGSCKCVGVPKDRRDWRTLRCTLLSQWTFQALGHRHTLLRPGGLRSAERWRQAARRPISSSSACGLLYCTVNKVGNVGVVQLLSSGSTFIFARPLLSLSLSPGPDHLNAPQS
jgi:hypothetical protein